MGASSGEKTEQATPKRKREQREKGNILKSHDLAVALQLLGIFVVIKIFAPSIGQNLQLLMLQFFPGQTVADQPLTISATTMVYQSVMLKGILIIGPIFIFAILAAILSNVLQSGLLFTTKTMGFKFERISPMKGLKRMFSSRSIVEMVKSIAKIAIVIFAVYQEFADNTRDVANLLSYNILASCGLIFDLIINLAIRCGSVLLVLAIADYLYQWFKRQKEMMMTKQEVKDEYKLTEGNPQTKGRIRQIQRLLASRRMMQDVPLADVVITNPTHFAIALRYDPEQDAAPVVLAKGKNMVAARIKEIARENRVMTVENRPLAQSLYKMCKVGSQIPADLYKAVAEILAYVFKMKEGKR